MQMYRHCIVLVCTVLYPRAFTDMEGMDGWMCVCVWMDGCVCVWMGVYVCMYVYVYVCVYVC